jgi:hypothetical protein
MADPPLAVEIAGPLTGALALSLLKRWSTQHSLQRANPETLRRVFREHGLRNPQHLDELVQRLRSAAPLARDPALVESHALRVQTLLRQIRALNEAIDDFENSSNVTTARPFNSSKPLDNGPQMSLPRKVVKPTILSCRRERGIRSANFREVHTPVPGASILIRQSRSRSVYLQVRTDTTPDSVIPGVCRTDRRPSWQDQP